MVVDGSFVVCATAAANVVQAVAAEAEHLLVGEAICYRVQDALHVERPGGDDGKHVVLLPGVEQAIGPVHQPCGRCTA